MANCVCRTCSPAPKLDHVTRLWYAITKGEEPQGLPLWTALSSMEKLDYQSQKVDIGLKWPPALPPLIIALEMPSLAGQPLAPTAMYPCW